METKIKLDQIQIALFTSAFEAPDVLALAQELRAVKSVDLLGEPAILPLPLNAPLEIPRVILKSSDGRVRLNVALSRLDVFWGSRKPGEETEQKTKEENEATVASLAQEVCSIIQEKYSVRVNRAGVISTFILELDESSKTFLLSKLFKKDALSGPEEMKLNFLTKSHLDGYEINEWLRLDTLRNVNTPADDKALRVVIDINSISGADYDFTKDKIGKFLKLCFTETEKELDNFLKN